jgi:hypothetical protein
MKMAALPQAIYRCNAIAIKIPMSFIPEIEKSILKFTWKHKRPQLAKVILSKKSSTRSTQYWTFNYTIES